MEADLMLLRRDMKLTSAPKRAALEHLRTKLEGASERVREAKRARDNAAAALALAEAGLQGAVAQKEALTRDLNSLILESSQQQMEALERLQSRMDSLTAMVESAVDADGAVDGVAAAVFAQPSSPAAETAAVHAARMELEAAAAVSAVEAQRARGRHVQLTRGSDRSTTPALCCAGPTPGDCIPPPQQQRAPAEGAFAGFAV
jgi:chromosome segregation ATPase